MCHYNFTFFIANKSKEALHSLSTLTANNDNFLFVFLALWTLTVPLSVCLSSWLNDTFFITCNPAVYLGSCWTSHAMPHRATCLQRYGWVYHGVESWSKEISRQLLQKANYNELQKLNSDLKYAHILLFIYSAFVCICVCVCVNS